MKEIDTVSSKFSNRKTRILGIAPYEGMKAIMQKLAESRNDLELDVFVGDMQEGVEIARRNFHNNYDIIISRGGTAKLLNQISHLPVIEVELSVYDILRAIKLSENYSGRYAMVGFPGITENAHLLCDLLQYHIDIFTVNSSEEAESTIINLKKDGYQMILCDMIAHTIAKRLELNSILITSGIESISDAFDQAVKLSSSYISIKSENHFYCDILRGGSDQVIVLKENGDLFFSTFEEGVPSALNGILLHEVSSVIEKKTQKFFKNMDGVLYSFNCRKYTFLGENYAAFYFSSNQIPFSTGNYGIQYSTWQDAEDDFANSFYGITGSAAAFQTTIEHINQTSLPIMLSGETGTGKEQIARAIYCKSQYHANPLITVNCALLGDRNWNFLTNHYNSPFNDSNNTIYLKDITSLPQNKRQQLLSIILDTSLCKRNRIIFSANCAPGQGISPEAMEFVNQLSCLMIQLPPLRERASEIPTMASLYLNTLNFSMTNQIIGLEPEAMDLLQNYEWPYNYTQFKRVLNELALAASTPYIQKEQTASFLQKEQQANMSLSSSAYTGSTEDVRTDHSIDLTRPLSEITQKIIRIVLEDCNGNQSAAAKQLGIGRSTLWRYLK
ncbi:MAG: PrpR N-terminal domain-containing protein [Muricoprocola sp.]